MRRRNALRFEGNPEAKPSREAVARGRARRTNEFARSPKSSLPAAVFKVGFRTMWDFRPHVLGNLPR